MLDTNCLLMSVSKRSGYYWLFEMLQQDKLELVVTTEILGEYEEIMGRFYFPVYADVLITYDKHFKELDLISFPKVVRMTIEEFNVFLSS